MDINLTAGAINFCRGKLLVKGDVHIFYSVKEWAIVRIRQQSFFK